MNKIDREIIKRFKTDLFQRLEIHSITLFGSRARGDADPDSDMDVAVVINGPVDDETRDYISDCAWQAGFEHGIVVVPVVFAKDEWEKGPERYSLLAKALATEGLPV